MTNRYFNHSSGWPAQASHLSSSPGRAEIDAIAAGFDIVDNYAVDVGTVNAIVVPALAALTSLSDGLKFRVKVLFATTGSTTLTPGSLGTIAVKYPDGTGLVINSLLAGQIAEFTYNATTGTLQYTPNSVLIAANGLPITGGTMSGPINEIEGASVAINAGDVNLTTSTGNMVHVTGSGAVTSITLAQGQRTIVFDGAPLLTQSANLLLPGNALNIQVAANDTATVWAEGGGITRVMSFTRSNGNPITSIPAASHVMNRLLFGAF